MSPRMGFCGPSYQSQSISADNQACINFYPELDESGAGNAPIMLYPTPGLKEFSDLTRAGAVESTDGVFNDGAAVSTSNTTSSIDATAFLFACTQVGVGGSPTTGLTATGGFSYFGGVNFRSDSDELTAQTTLGASFSSLLTFTGGGGPHQTSAGAMVTLNGLLNVVLHGIDYQSAFGTTGSPFGVYYSDLTFPFANPITVGNGMFLALYGVGAGANCFASGTFSVTDTAGNIWSLLVDTGDVVWNTPNLTRVLVFYAQNCLAGTPTIRITSTHDAFEVSFRLFEASVI